MWTVWILGDQLHPEVNALRDATPADTRALMIESRLGRDPHVSMLYANLRRKSAEDREATRREVAAFLA